MVGTSVITSLCIIPTRIMEASLSLIPLTNFTKYGGNNLKPEEIFTKAENLGLQIHPMPDMDYRLSFIKDQNYCKTFGIQTLYSYHTTHYLSKEGAVVHMGDKDACVAYLRNLDAQ